MLKWLLFGAAIFYIMLSTAELTEFFATELFWNPDYSIFKFIFPIGMKKKNITHRSTCIQTRGPLWKGVIPEKNPRNLKENLKW